MKKDPSFNKNQLGNLLERYKTHFQPPQASVEKECILVIKDVTGIELTKQQISYSVVTRTLVIKAPSLIRSELKTKHPLILKELSGRLGSKNPPVAII